MTYVILRKREDCELETIDEADTEEVAMVLETMYQEENTDAMIYYKYRRD